MCLSSKKSQNELKKLHTKPVYKSNAKMMLDVFFAVFEKFHWELFFSFLLCSYHHVLKLLAKNYASFKWTENGNLIFYFIWDCFVMFILSSVIQVFCMYNRTKILKNLYLNKLFIYKNGNICEKFTYYLVQWIRTGFYGLNNFFSRQNGIWKCEIYVDGYKYLWLKFLQLKIFIVHS